MLSGLTQSDKPKNGKARIWTPGWLAPKFCFSQHYGDKAQKQYFCIFESKKNLELQN